MTKLDRARAKHVIAKIRLDRFRAEYGDKDWSAQTSLWYLQLAKKCGDAWTKLVELESA